MFSDTFNKPCDREWDLVDTDLEFGRLWSLEFRDEFYRKSIFLQPR